MDIDDGEPDGVEEVDVFCKECGRRNDGRSDLCTHCGERLIGNRPVESLALNEWIEAQMSMRNAAGVPSSVWDLRLLRSWAERADAVPFVDDAKTLASLDVPSGSRGSEDGPERRGCTKVTLVFAWIAGGFLTVYGIGAIAAGNSVERTGGLEDLGAGYAIVFGSFMLVIGIPLLIVAVRLTYVLVRESRNRE